MVELNTSTLESEADGLDVEASLAAARRAQQDWANVSLSRRLHCVRNLRDALARDGRELTRCFSPDLQRTPADSVVAEILPLAEAARFLERNACKLLRSRRLPSRGRPRWLSQVRIELRREPVGTVLIVGPSNYPLFLPGVQALQALAAGNAVLLKPGRGGWPVAIALKRLAVEAGIPPSLFTVLDENVASARAALNAGVDKVVMTGSAASGIAVLRDAAEKITPATVELSGCDSVFIRPDADIAKAVRAVVFGMTLNGGATCIAPRRIFVNQAVAERFEQSLRMAVESLPPIEVNPPAASLAHSLIRSSGADACSAADSQSALFPPTVLFNARPEMAVMQADLFAPLVCVMRVDNDAEAIAAAGRCPYSLGATIFGKEVGARNLAARVPAGVVVINDMIVPTADPRLPFGGSGQSGFGKTRGAEGLLEMTNLKAVVTQRANRLRHLEPPHSRAEELFLAFLAAQHRAKWTDRLQAWKALGRIVTRKHS